ncbi:uncharacterized protein [Montipora capricornis]|uniref:uncharacterized protein n=1 Tax=Montipora capricornis TaxID=246305 RepID=UPI0035F0FCAA
MKHPRPSNVTNVLYENCRTAAPNAVCAFANVCGCISNAIWFIVLAPQIWKNWKRRSVEGLSVLWASANFTASLVNCFYVFSRKRLPLYIKISAVYMPVLEFFILVQFLCYSQRSVRTKFVYGGGCFLIWIIVVTLELCIENAAPNIQWIAIVLWSIESFLQVTLNMHLRTTSGQSTLSVVLGLLGKTTDFLSNYLLLLPVQYVIMTYYSSTLVYINGIQVIWYPKPQPKRTPINHTACGGTGRSNEEALEASDSDECLLVGDPEGASVEEMASVCTHVEIFEFRARMRDIPSYQKFFAAYLCLAVLVFSVCVCVFIPSGWGIFAPCLMIVALISAFLYRNHREGRIHVAHCLLASFDKLLPWGRLFRSRFYHNCF